MRPLRRLHHHLPDRCHRRPYTVDARRCISYLTIELEGAIGGIPAAARNRIYGCDDCQLICPWNRFRSSPTKTISAHAPRCMHRS